MRFPNICSRIIEYSFYALFLLVPLAFTDKTSELFEMNKMWLTWGLTIIVGMAWFTKMILEKKIYFQKTPLDIPIGLFLLSQLISTIFSLDFHTSWWGYYSRFNGGFLSIFSYIFLYYAFLSNFKTNIGVVVKRSLFLSLICGLIVSLWGLPSHFGYDPTCLIFRGTLDVSCWTSAFMPKVRIFSTLGQADWLSAYLVILIPIAIVYIVNRATAEKQQKTGKNWMSIIFYIATASLFYLDLLYTRSRSGFIAIWISLIVLVLLLLKVYKKKIFEIFTSSNIKMPAIILCCLFFFMTFYIGSSISLIDRFSFKGISEMLIRKESIKSVVPQAETKTTSPTPTTEMGGTDSGKIRLLVWKGAINAWKSSPLFGTGVETFAYAYYKYKPAGQNLTSEWNYLYNKAHNEFLNYLATTGILGLGTYLYMIFSFIYLAIKKIFFQSETKTARNLLIALFASYISILITNFFGFSVVITNIYLFLIPAFIIALSKQPNTKMIQQVNKAMPVSTSTTAWQWTSISLILIIGILMLSTLLRFWRADISYALGYNLDQAKSYDQAYQNLSKAISLRNSEPLFKDELSVNNAIIAATIISQKSKEGKLSDQDLQSASNYAQAAINLSNEVVSQNSNNAVFWKNRVRLFYTLAQVDSRYLPRAIDAIEHAFELAPNDANISYNKAVLYGQNNNIAKGIEAMEKTVELKPNYRDAQYALGLFYHTASLDKDGKTVVNNELNKKAVAQMEYILKNLNPEDSDAKKSLENWK